MANVKLQNLMLLSLASFFWTFNETYSRATNTSTTLYFGLMLSLSGDDQSSGALAGVQAALNDINSRDDLLPGYSLDFTPIHTKVRILIAISFRVEGICNIFLKSDSVTEELQWMGCSLSYFNPLMRRLH